MKLWFQKVDVARWNDCFLQQERDETIIPILGACSVPSAPIIYWLMTRIETYGLWSWSHNLPFLAFIALMSLITIFSIVIHFLVFVLFRHLPKGTDYGGTL